MPSVVEGQQVDLVGLIRRGKEIAGMSGYDVAAADEGELNQIYGRIGCGKTLLATIKALKLLRRGQVVYTNWEIAWDGYDERDSRWLLFKGLLGLKKEFYVFPKDNLKFIKVDEEFIDKLGQLSDCTVMLDEGHLVLDSYTKTSMDMDRRNAVLWTRHFDRTIIVISQRPSAIHVTMRANVNRFYKCEKTFDFAFFGHRFQRFLVTEFQDVTSSDVPDESRVMDEDKETGFSPHHTTNERTSPGALSRLAEAAPDSAILLDWYRLRYVVGVKP